MRTLWFSALMAGATLCLAAQSEGAMGSDGFRSGGRGFSGNRGGPPTGFTSGNRGFTGGRGTMPGGFTSPNRTFIGNRGVISRGFTSPNRMFPGNRTVAFGGGRPNWSGTRTFDRDRFGGRRFFRHDRGSFSFFLGGFPWYYYPSYGYYPAYSYPVYEPSPAYYYPDAYAPAPQVYDSSAGDSSSAPSPAVQVRSWLELGHDWAKDLRLDIVTWDQLVVYERAYIVNGSPTVRDEFRRGFLSGYGLHAEEAYAKSLKQAVELSAADQNAAPPAMNSTQPAPSSPPSNY